MSVIASFDPKQKYNNDKLTKKIRRNVGKAIADYNMIEDGDVVMAAISGGKDSFAMLDILLSLKKSAPIHFDVIAVNLDQKQPGFPEHILPEYLESKDIPYYIIDKDTYSVVKAKIDEGKTTCGLCSRLRRGSLYSFAETIGATKIALGHHMDDMVETTFLNMFYGAKMKSMPPKLLSDDKRNIVIRPLAYCREKDIQKLAEVNDYPIIPCNLCGSQENLQRQNIKAMLTDWDKLTPGRVENIFKSFQNISPSQMADTQLFDFETLSIDRTSPKKEYEFNSEEVSSTNIDESLVIQIANL
ncbi:tRNA 2-thiocytidine(32) synthetase TtcA [Glaciecola sp.]|jgi:tRNA 2-thiocytidine biosynthesis protein TtcA|uniref:tRNA 2-thiocytidine(32) synthetase TtcA n=1 Tax=Glaciecola sp. MF2-115 TaxID=3384827 RepID=UPI00398A0F86|mmetsp:Transcript_31024/g.99052  ORF Transcript_31024/g.99052 Transcript_31024/m.99052 type:complete len:300 (+) Transcript_31024:686-1585(+)